MKGYRLFLAYYTFILSLGSFIWSFFYAPKPQGFYLTALILPVSIYFWLLIMGISKTPSSPENQNTKTKLPMIILAILLISSVSIIVYSAIASRSSYSKSTSTPTSQLNSLKADLENQSKKSYEDLTKELADIKDQLINMKTTQNAANDIGIFDDAAVLAGTLTIADKKNLTVNVYAEKSATSAAVGKAEFGKNYTFIEKDQNWYLILLGTEEGFINSQFVKEIQY